MRDESGRSFRTHHVPITHQGLSRCYCIRPRGSVDLGVIPGLKLAPTLVDGTSVAVGISRLSRGAGLQSETAWDSQAQHEASVRQGALNAPSIVLQSIAHCHGTSYFGYLSTNVVSLTLVLSISIKEFSAPLRTRTHRPLVVPITLMRNDRHQTVVEYLLLVVVLLPILVLFLVLLLLVFVLLFVRL